MKKIILALSLIALILILFYARKSPEEVNTPIVEVAPPIKAGTTVDTPSTNEAEKRMQDYLTEWVELQQKCRVNLGSLKKSNLVSSDFQVKKGTTLELLKSYLLPEHFQVNPIHAPALGEYNQLTIRKAYLTKRSETEACSILEVRNFLASVQESFKNSTEVYLLLEKTYLSQLRSAQTLLEFDVPLLSLIKLYSVKPDKTPLVEKLMLVRKELNEVSKSLQDPVKAGKKSPEDEIAERFEILKKESEIVSILKSKIIDL